MSKEDALVLLGVMRMEAVHEPPGLDKQHIARAIAEMMANEARRYSGRDWRTQPDHSLAQMR